jgi:hypothetical protein
MTEDLSDDTEKVLANDSSVPGHEAADKKPDSPAQQQKVMEVIHPPDLRHRKKPWKVYFLEFTMIFLAVTLGFFAETLREFISDNRHARQLGGQLIHDLKNDSAILNDNMSRDTLLIKKTDSLFNLLQRPVSEIDSRRLQELIHSCYNINLFQPSSGAISAIKIELRLRRFASSDITVYISKYETLQSLLKTIEQFQMENLKQYIEGFITAHFTPANAYSSVNYGPIVNGDLRNITQNDLTQLSVNLAFVKSYNMELLQVSSELKINASEFIQYVNNEFE